MGCLGWDSNPFSLKHVHSVSAALLFQFSLHVYLCHGEVKLQQVLLALVKVTAETKLLVELEEAQQRIVLKVFHMKHHVYIHVYL